MKYIIGDPTSAPSTISTGNPSSNSRYHTSSDPDFINQGSQEAQVRLQIYVIIFIFNIISSSYSSQRATCTFLHGGMRIIHIGLHGNRALFSSTSSLIYNKYRREQAKEILFNKFMINSDKFQFDPVRNKIGNKLSVRTYKQKLSEYGP